MLSAGSATGVSISIAAGAEIFLVTSKSRLVFISIQLPVWGRFPWDKATGVCKLADICVLRQGYEFVELQLRFSACVSCFVLQHRDNFAVFLVLFVSPETSLYHHRQGCLFFDVLLTVRLSIFISIFNQLDAQNLFYNKFCFMPLHVSSTRAHHQEVKIAVHSLWYHHTYRCDDTRGCVMQF